MSQIKISKKKLNLLQVFRGLAAVLVILIHGNSLFAINLKQPFLSNAFKFGSAGVNFFFVLSGFIIYYVHKNDIGKKFKFKEFLFKRFLRVYPIYWIVLIPRLFSTTKDINFITCLSSFVLFPYPSPPIVNVSWTLSFEVFFYLVFSLTILAGLRYLAPLIFIWLATISFYWFFHSLNILTLPKNNLSLEFILSGHHLEFCFGCLAAYIVTKFKVRQATPILALGITLFSLSSIANVHIVNTIADSQSYPLYVRAIAPILTPMEEFSFVYYGIPSMLIVIGAAALDLNREIQIPSIFIYLGDASYSVYLTHASVINILTNLIAKMHLENMFYSDLSKFFILIISLLVGCIFHSYIEQPLLKVFRKKILVSRT
ncbi:MAG: acyltransferase [Desmonostoc vinosum HA7617-LM4]|jgi:peptidoglycan/LPS O-acetylase OafA/YrhL|nr:acyltransferase [Desmonostoc vinosum HA7617-LM4]